jgi:phosphohistidine phosphatase
MRLTLLRHGKGVERDDWPGPDSERPLTKVGVDHAVRTCLAMRPLVGPVLEAVEIWTSPWLRARHTAELAAATWELPLREMSWLAGGAAAVESWPLAAADGTVLVGHEPELSRLLCWLCDLGSGDSMELRKGGLAVLEGDPHAGGMQLYCLLPPKVIRRLGE